MNKREARQYISSNPPADPTAERRNSLLGRLFAGRRSSSVTEDTPMMTGIQRRASVEQPEISITQRVQQEMPARQRTASTSSNSPEFSIFT